jgi:hypothetical protein
MSDFTERLLEYIARTQDAQRSRVSEAMDAANPDIDGDLMRHLDQRGVGDVIREGMEIVRSSRRGRSRFVQGWRP